MESRYRYDDWEKANNLYKNNHIKSIEIASSVNLEFPDVTFAIPAYMRPDTIQDAIKSVVAQKSQYSFIIMIVDDSGSDDIVTRKVLELLNKYPNIILYKNEKILVKLQTGIDVLNWQRRNGWFYYMMMIWSVKNILKKYTQQLLITNAQKWGYFNIS